MDNLYQKTEIKPHHLDREVCRIKCFDAFNILSASVALAGSYEMAEEEEPVENSTIFKLHPRLAEPRLSQLLLDIAVFVRTFDDVMRTWANIVVAGTPSFGTYSAPTSRRVTCTVTRQLIGSSSRNSLIEGPPRHLLHQPTRSASTKVGGGPADPRLARLSKD